MFDMVVFTMLSLAVAAASITTSRSKITDAFRANASVRWPLLGDLLGCPYCVSHYYSAFAALFFADSLLSYSILWMAVVAGSSLVNGAMQRLNWMHEVAVAKAKTALKEAEQRIAEKDAKISELREVLFELSARKGADTDAFAALQEDKATPTPWPK